MTVQKAAGAGSIQLVQIKGTDTDWQDMASKWGASWEIPQSPKPPLDLRVVATDGSEVSCGHLSAKLRSSSNCRRSGGSRRNGLLWFWDASVGVSGLWVLANGVWKVGHLGQIPR